MSNEVCPVCGGTGPEPKREPAEPMPEGWKEKLLAAHADAKQAERQPVTAGPSAETLDKWADEAEFLGNHELATEIRRHLVYKAPDSKPTLQGGNSGE